MIRQTTTKHGFTLLELMVVAGIISILAALALPAIQDAREAARRSTCKSRLSSLGVALASHVDATGKFPFTAFNHSPYTPYTNDFDRVFSPHVFLLPYIEASALFDATNFDVPARFSPAAQVTPDKENLTAAAPSISTFLCPSDARNISDRAWAPVSFRANYGPTAFKLVGAEQWPMGRRNGAFEEDRAVPPGEFTDGLAFTAMFSEKPIGDGALKYSPFLGYWVASAMPTTPEILLKFCAAMPANPDPMNIYMDTGTSWMLSGQRFTGYSHDAAPNPTFTDCAAPLNATYRGAHGSFAARSYHAGCVHVLFGDGHVTAASNGIDVYVWRAVGTRSGNESVKL